MQPRQAEDLELSANPLNTVMSDPDPHVRGSGSASALPWRVALRRELAWILLLKLVALALLWALFFRGGHQAAPGAAAVGQRFGLPSAAQPAPAPREVPGG
jgi:hypothetical protein